MPLGATVSDEVFEEHKELVRWMLDHDQSLLKMAQYSINRSTAYAIAIRLGYRFIGEDARNGYWTNDPMLVAEYGKQFKEEVVSLYGHKVEPRLRKRMGTEQIAKEVALHRTTVARIARVLGFQFVGGSRHGFWTDNPHDLSTLHPKEREVVGLIDDGLSVLEAARLAQLPVHETQTIVRRHFEYHGPKRGGRWIRKEDRYE